jgi:adenine-specific DNA-methyltransferase
MLEDTQLPLASTDPVADLLEQLRAAAPQVFSDGLVDFERLRAALGDQVDTGQERYGLNWAGKADAFRNVRAPAIGTLLPMPGDSINWDTTENLIIEGDNLEVLKLLQKPYHGKVKMIYIDPPYNTGNDFIYPDNYRQGLDDYLRYSGQVNEEGVKQSTNRDSSGRYHSDWLSMMYPRLFLARNLLRDDGVIFVSIDDNEVHNLRMLMNEVFGEENFVVELVWKSRQSEDTRAKTGVSTDHEYLLCYRRSEAAILRGTEKDLEKFSNPDNDKRGPWRSADLTGLAIKEQRPNLHYDLIDPATAINYGCPPMGWRYAREIMAKKIAEKRILFPTNKTGRPRHKLFLNEMRSLYKNISSIITSPTTADGTRECNELLGNGKFSFPKPSGLLKLLASQVASGDADIVLDFFAGSGTAAHAVFELNQDDQKIRRFILVQLPEKTSDADFPTIAHITRERVRRVIAKLDKEDGGKKSARGFRAFRLSSSNFRIWNADSTPDDPAKLTEQLQLYADNSSQARDEPDVLWELILKSGLPLSTTATRVKVADGTAWSVNEGKLLILLNKESSREILRAMIALQPQQILCLDAAFNGDDALKTSIVLEARSHGISFRTV